MAQQGAPPVPKDKPSSLSQVKDERIIGRTFFGEYEVVKSLGRGGMGAVYLAKQKSIGHDVAIKVLHARAAESDEHVKRFHREAKVISLLTHPNIVRVLIFGRTEDDLLCLALEFVDGKPLNEIIKLGDMDELRIIKIMKQLCSAVYEAHELGIVHRDLKPENVLLTKFRNDPDYVKILDFGIAKLLKPDASDDTQLTQAGIVYGSPHYMSPEQAQAIDLDHRTDIYALGCILYELLTGQRPFTGQTPAVVLRKQVNEQPTPLDQAAPLKASAKMQEIINTAMAKSPDDRFESGLEMFTALLEREHEIIQERGIDPNSTYFPNSELTGLHRAVDAKPIQKQDRPTDNAPRKPEPGMVTLDKNIAVGVVGGMSVVILILLAALLIAIAA
ncbi:MAG: serine/threonine protein kinase [Myxococcota bacterium]